MNPPEDDKAPVAPAAKEQAEPAVPTTDPDLVEGLKQLYGSVVNEPLPAALQELLDRLDDSEAR